MDFSEKDFSKFEFSISLILLFNPKLLPKVLKPSESDYQDTKILYYYPEENIKQEEKRNQVGLIEGSYHFWDIFSVFQSEENSKKPGFEIIYLEDYIHIMKEVETDYWLLLVIKPLVIMPAIKIDDYDYLNANFFNYDENVFNEENCKKFLNNFYQTFFLFHGSFASFFSVDDNTMNKNFHEIMKHYVKYYIILNAHSGQMINLLKFNFMGINYSPIDKKKFLSLQYLINILQAIEKRLEHFALFYSGYFVFSTFDQKDLQILYDYFFITHNSCEIDQTKIVNRFEKLGLDEKINNLFYGILNKPNNIPNGYLYGPLNLNESKIINDVRVDELISFTPTINIYDPTQKKTIKQQLFSFYDKNLMLIMTCNLESKIEKNRLMDIQTAICTNSEKVSQNLEKQLIKVLNQSETYRMLYFNKMNLAMKISNKINIGFLDYETLKFADDIKTELELKENLFMNFKKANNFWVYGIKGNGRIVIFLIPGNISFQKVEDEKEEIMKFFFSNIFI